ncbi:DNA polymerase III subunit chi [Coralloluteibacterium stylophorae]|uniref:DNA polymerase III subunit chi n=1 Tax=Coralloluteibacterium stylophorae TaxID=1776034 RepID=A0A8J7VXG2_9GAMM|nr:DNA polymerase III subunit chi [Coralloluteibacterium stylophorae]MBS7457793.1 DNA polymerase III subunit chi [Coralloluteibacterium stylophorae]
MPRADFYLIAKPRFRDDPLRLVCELARRAHDTGSPTLILARDRAQAEALDDALWAFDAEAYIPHQIAGEEDPDEDEITPVVIAPPEIDVPDRPMVINLRDDAFAGQCDRVLEVVPADPAAREPLRERWRQYKARGFETNKHDM